MTLLEADIRTVTSEQCALVDVVISNSVYEHLDDVEGITKSLAALTKPDGAQVHFIDLRDHYFKYPFEMLKFSEKIWYSWLNPTSNHNRFRLWDYRKVFEKYFGKVDIQILERDESNFKKPSEILPEFISGKLEDDCVTLISVVVLQAGRINPICALMYNYCILCTFSPNLTLSDSYPDSPLARERMADCLPPVRSPPSRTRACRSRPWHGHEHVAHQFHGAPATASACVLGFGFNCSRVWHLS